MPAPRRIVKMAQEGPWKSPPHRAWHAGGAQQSLSLSISCWTSKDSLFLLLSFWTVVIPGISLLLQRAEGRLDPPLLRVPHRTHQDPLWFGSWPGSLVREKMPASWREGRSGPGEQWRGERTSLRSPSGEGLEEQLYNSQARCTGHLLAV